MPEARRGDLRASAGPGFLLSFIRDIGEHRSRGEPIGGSREHPCMDSPLRNSPDPSDPDADRLPPSRVPDRNHQHAAAGHRPDEAAANADLQRLESSLQWLKRESMIARLEAERPARKENRRLPRASQLPPVPGIRPLGFESSCRWREASIFRLTPPLPHERLQLPPLRRERRYDLRAGLCILIASGIAGSIAYHISAGGWFPASELAQASHLQAQRWQTCQERCDNESTFMNRALRRHSVGLWF
jgi:hypothetical protein